MSIAQHEYPRLMLNARQLCDYEMLQLGAFNPLTGFMCKNDYQACVSKMRLADGQLWPMPITLAVSSAFVTEHLIDFSAVEPKLKNHRVILTDGTNLPLAILKLHETDWTQSVYQPDYLLEAQQVYQATYLDENGSEQLDTNHPYAEILAEYHRHGLTYCLGGQLIETKPVPHFDFQAHRLTPDQIKEKLPKDQSYNLVGFQTRNPMHRSHFELTKFALAEASKNGQPSILFLNPVVGVTQTTDINYHVRVKCYQEIVKYYEEPVILSLLPLSMRMAGPREAVWHALIRKNYGCTHFIVGRDHAGPSYKRKNGQNFYGPYEAQDLLWQYQQEIGLTVIKSEMIVFSCERNHLLSLTKDQENLANLENLEKDLDFMTQLAETDGQFKQIGQVSSTEMVFNISGTMQRQMLRENRVIPSWFTFPSVSRILHQEFSNRPGLVFYFVGLSGAGKTFISKHFVTKLQELTCRHISHLDADEIRENISKGLGFTKADRSTNIRRIGYVISKIVYHGGLAVCANIAPFEEDRKYNRKLIEATGGKYIEIFVNTAVEVCAERDVKGLYQLAQQDKIKLTGVNDQFDAPFDAELVLDGNQPITSLMATLTNYVQQHHLLE